MELSQKQCIPCQGGIPPLTPAEIEPLIKELAGGWQEVENHHLFKEFTLPSFAENLKATNAIGELAEQIGHHPNLYLSFKILQVTIYTHKIDGLAEADFILAAKIDQLLKK